MSTDKIKIIRVILINFLVLMLFAMFIELALRLLHIPYNQTWIPSESAIGRFDKELGWHYLPNTSKTITIGENTREYHFDKDGIRVPNANFIFDYRKPTVIFIGSSYTMGHGLSYEETYISKLGVLLSGTGYQFVNLGVQAYGSDQALILLKRYMNKFNTKIIVYTFTPDHLIYDSNNDRRILFPNAKFLGTKPLFSLNSNNELFIKKTPEKYSNYLNSYVLDLIKITVGHKLGVFPPYSTKLTKAIITEMNHFCTTNNARFILLNWRTQPSDYNDFDDLNIEKIDTLENPPANFQNMTIPGDGHPNSEATDYVAELLFEYFTRNPAPLRGPQIHDKAPIGR